MGEPMPGTLGGPFAAPPPRNVRAIALDLAVKTVVNSRQFTVSQIVNTASAYEAYITDGTVPPVTMPPGATRAAVAEEVKDASVED